MNLIKVHYMCSILCLFFVTVLVEASETSFSKDFLTVEGTKNIQIESDLQEDVLIEEGILTNRKESEDLINLDLSRNSIKPYVLNKESFKVEGKMVFKAKFFSDNPSSDALFNSEFYGRFKWEVLDFLSFFSQAVLVGRNGFTQSIYDRGDLENGLNIIESYFDINLSFFQLKFGSIRQDFLKAPFLVTDKTFPSLIEVFSLQKSEDWNLKLLFQQAIMSNSVESIKRQPQKIEGFPLFLTSSLFLNIKNFMNVELEDYFTFFTMYNLPPAVAENSRTLGNTLDTRYQGSDSQFTYSFLGFYNSINILKPITENWKLGFGGDIIYNFLAPDYFNQGEKLYVSLYHNYNNLVELQLKGEYFANQSDTSVAYFNSELYGHNNREGFFTSLIAYFYDSGITFGFRYVASDAINGGHKTATGFANSFSIFLMSNYLSVF